MIADQQEPPQGPLNFDYDVNRARLARIVAGVPDDPASIDPAIDIWMRNAHDQSWFVTSELGFLDRRGQTIQELVTAHRILNGAKLDRRVINDASTAGALTGRALVKIDLALERMANHGHEAVRALVAGTGTDFRVKSSSIVAALYWVNRSAVADVLGKLGVTGTEAGTLLFGEAPYARSFFANIEQGLRRPNSANQKRPEAGARYDYRVGIHTANHVMTGLQALYDGLPAKHAALSDGLPSFQTLFDAHHTAGAQNGKKTIPLPIQNGNRARATSDVEVEQVRGRIAAFCTARASGQVAAS